MQAKSLLRPATIPCLLWACLSPVSSSVAQAKAISVQAERAEPLDRALETEWKRLGLHPSPAADDSTFLRRIYLDLVGRIPTRREIAGYRQDQSQQRRIRVISQLLNSPGFEAHWFHFFADMLRIQSRANGAQGDMTSKPYLEHIRRRIRENMPFDALARELVTAQGKVWDNPAIGYFMRDLAMPLDHLANTVRVFLGTRIECAQCHNHPFDQWTQRQFYQLAAFTYPVETNFTGVAEQDALRQWARAAQQNPTTSAQARHLGRVFENLGDFVRYSKVQVLPNRVLKLPQDYAYKDAAPMSVVSPATLMGPAASGGLPAFAQWLTCDENPRFARVIANRLWRKLFGVGVIEPVDDLQDSTQASNPTLMGELERLMRELRYDLRSFLGVLVSTRAYQAKTDETEVQPGVPSAFLAPHLRRMSAEQLYDSLVTLIHPTPDLPCRQGIDAETAAKLMHRGKLSDALDLLTTREVFDGALQASETYERVTARSKPMVTQYAAAVKAKDKALMEKLNLEIRSVEFVARTGIHEHVVVPAVARLYEKRTGKPAPAPPPVRTPSLDELRKPGQNRDYIEIPGYNMTEQAKAAEMMAQRQREALYHREAAAFKVADSQAFLQARRAHHAQWPRAVELESPAPRGHLLREFGQSDRDLIDNSSQDASMGQALALLNGGWITATLQPFTQLSLELEAASNQQQRIEALWLMILSRPPSPEDLATLARHQLHEPADLVPALINTREFLFIR